MVAANDVSMYILLSGGDAGGSVTNLSHAYGNDKEVHIQSIGSSYVHAIHSIRWGEST